MSNVKRLAKLCAEVIITLGALACILEWLGIKPSEVSRMTWPHWMWLAFGLVLFAASLYSSIRSWAQAPTSAKLTIHSATYGTGQFDDIDVTQAIRSLSNDVCVLPVENDVLGPDPAFGKFKRILVEYSYGSKAISKLSKPEHGWLVIPPSSPIDKFANEIEALRLARPIPVTSVPAKPKEPERLTVRIMEGYFGQQSNDPQTELIVLNVKVDGEPATVNKWSLQIEREGKHWQTGFQNPMNPKEPTMIEEWTERTDLRWAFKLVEGYQNPIPLKEPNKLPDLQYPLAKPASPVFTEFMPREGWVLFRVENAAPRFLELIFASTFIISSVEGEKATGKRVAGEWLHHALIGWPF